MAGDGGVLKIARRIWEVGVAGWSVTGRRRETAGYQWWRSSDITRMQNVSEYMLVLALCVVVKRAHYELRTTVVREIS